MSDKIQYLIIVDFGEYACKYLFSTHYIPEPDWKDDDKRWLTYSEVDEVVRRFKAWADNKIGGMNGKIVMIEPCDYVVADGYTSQS